MDLDAIEARATAATEGLWKRSAEQDDTPVVYRDHPAVSGAAQVVFMADWGTEADAEFAAHARQDVPALVARVRELEGENEKLRRQLDTAHGKRPGAWDTWDEHAARKQATPPEPPPKPVLSLEEARKQAAEHAARARDIAKEEK